MAFLIAFLVAVGVVTEPSTEQKSMNFGSLVVCLHMADELGLTMDDVRRLNQVADGLREQAKEGNLSFAEADKRLRKDIYTSIRGSSKDFAAYLFQHDLATGDPVAAMRWIGEKYTAKSATKLRQELDSEDAKPYVHLRQDRIALGRWVFEPIISTDKLMKAEGEYYKPKSEYLQQPLYATIMENIDVEAYRSILPLMGELKLTLAQIETVRAARKKAETLAAKFKSEEGIPLFGEGMTQHAFPNRDPAFADPGSSVETKPFEVERVVYTTITDELTADQKKRFDQLLLQRYLTGDDMHFAVWHLQRMGQQVGDVSNKQFMQRNSEIHSRAGVLTHLRRMARFRPIVQEHLTDLQFRDLMTRKRYIPGEGKLKLSPVEEELSQKIFGEVEPVDRKNPRRDR